MLAFLASTPARISGTPNDNKNYNTMIHGFGAPEFESHLA